MRMSDWSSECALPITSGHNSPMNDPDPLLVEALATFDTLFDEALAAGEPDRTAMVVATASADACPPARTVLLKAHDTHGFVFYTPLDGRKVRELPEHSRPPARFHRPPRPTGRP